jgi:pimeloyl-ACP methyl ester carboxylesterase
VGALAVVEPEAYSLLPNDTAEYVQIRTLRDRWRAHVRAGRWYEAFEEFIDFYNGPASFAQWPPGRRSEFLSIQQARGDLWDVLFHGLAAEALAAITAPVHVIEGSRSSPVDRAICRIVRQEVPQSRHTVIDGAGHMMPVTHPAQLTRALVGGLGGDRRAPRPAPCAVSTLRQRR